MQAIRIETVNDPRVLDFQDIPDPVRLRELGSFVAEGRFAVRSLLLSDNILECKLLVTDSALEGLADSLKESSRSVLVYVASRDLLRQIGGYDFHQGCLGLAVRPEPREVGYVLSVSMPFRPLVILERIGDPDNLGGIFRNAAAFGAGGVLLSPGCCDPLYRKAVRTSIATTLQIPYAVVNEWPNGLIALRDCGYTLVALTPKNTALELHRYRLPEGSSGAAFLLGNEGDGLTAAAMSLADCRVRIPLETIVDSLNVATASGLALYHARGLRDHAELRGV